MSERNRAEFYLFLVTFIWGSTFVVTKSLLAHVTPAVYVAVRFSLATVLLFAITPRSILRMTRKAAVQGLILGLLLFAGFVLQTIGLNYTTASKSAFMTGMLVVFTPLCQLFIEKRPPKGGNIAGIVIVTVGLYLLTSPEGADFNRGDLMTLLCAFLFGIYIVYLDIFGRESDPSQLTWMQFIVSAVLGAVAAPLMEVPKFEVSASVMGALCYLAVFATVIALSVQARYQRDTTPTRSAVIFSLEPVIAACFAFLVLGERMGVAGAIGGGLIVGGVLVSEFSDHLVLRLRRSDG